MENIVSHEVQGNPDDIYSRLIELIEKKANREITSNDGQICIMKYKHWSKLYQRWARWLSEDVVIKKREDAVYIEYPSGFQSYITKFEKQLKNEYS